MSDGPSDIDLLDSRIALPNYLMEAAEDNPATRVISYPPSLPLEVAMQAVSNKQICAAYGLSREDWEQLIRTPSFVAEVASYRDELRKDGMSFKMKARLQAEELLTTSWKLIHAPSDQVGPAVKADLIKTIFRVAGLEPEKGAGGGNVTGLNIQINL